MADKFDFRLIDAGEDSLPEADPAIQQMLKKDATVGNADIARTLHNIPYAGTSTKQELLELEQQMRNLIEEGTNTYKYIESFLLNIGYNLNKIRQTFKKLTGVDPTVYNDPQPYLDTPPTIPGLNYGWGESKNSKFDYYFIMPYNLGYAIFGQKGDLLREEVSFKKNLTEARKELEKLVKEPKYFDKVVTLKDIHQSKSEFEKPEKEDILSEPLVGVKTAALQKIDAFLKAQNFVNKHEVLALLKHAFEQGDITKQELKYFIDKYQLTKKAEEETSDRVFELEKKVLEEPVEKELKELTPKDFFENELQQQKDLGPAKALEAVENFLDENVRSQTSEFEINTRSFKYKKVEVEEKIEKTPPVDGYDTSSYLTSEAVIVVVIEIVDKTLPKEINTKYGIVPFSIVDGEVQTPGTFKGEDNQIYALNEAGFEKYFAKERANFSTNI